MVGRRVLTSSEVERTLHRLALEVVERHAGTELPHLLPASSKGEQIVRQLQVLISQEGRSVSLWKPDTPSQFVLLVDDVLHTGRTLFRHLLSLGESPARIEALVLVDRGHRLFPIVPDYVGLRLATTLQEYVEVRSDGEGWEVWLV